jgi:release factor glutamine methyltransferase
MAGRPTILLRQRFHDNKLAILEVSRGTGPRALQEWLNEQEEGCGFLLAGPPHYSAYAKSLVLIAQSDALTDIVSYKMYTHGLVKGYVEDAIEIKSIVDGKEHISHLSVNSVTRSNQLGFISHVTLTNLTNMAPRQFRRHCKQAGFPVLGSAKDACPFQGESLCLSTVQLDVTICTETDGEEMVVSVSTSPSPRLQTIMDREERFWDKRQGTTDPHNDDVILTTTVAPPQAYQEQQAIFCGLDFFVSPSVMIPRAGSEALVDQAMALLSATAASEKTHRILDLGTGSGCLLLSLLHQLPGSTGVGVDISEAALQVARQNASRLGLETRARFVQGSFDEPRINNDCFDIVVCNPPYHTRGGRHQLDEVTVAHEPGLALFVIDNADWILSYRQALSGIIKLRQEQPMTIVFEVFSSNSAHVAKLLSESGWENVEIGTDSRGCVRTVSGVMQKR